MSKRPLSPAPLPLPKRAHAAPTHHGGPARGPLVSFHSLYDEVTLHIFSYLAWTDLCAVQPTSRSWARLALDNQLWKALYLAEFGRARLRGGRGHETRADGREVRPLPGRAKARADLVTDWKRMFRISANWRSGRSVLERVAPHVDDLRGGADGPDGGDDGAGRTHLLLAGPLMFFAPPCVSDEPAFTMRTQDGTSTRMPCPSARQHARVHITALALDQSAPSPSSHLRLAAFLSTGEFLLFALDTVSPSGCTRTARYVPRSSTPRNSPIVHAAYHHPLLATLSRSFHLSLYDLSADKPRHVQTLTSFSSFPPSSLVLSAPTPDSYKLVLAYAVPVYPAHWSVGATELLISGPADGETLRVSTTRTVRAFDVPGGGGWADARAMRAAREQWARKMLHVADTQTDGKWVVLGPGAPLPPAMSMPTALSPEHASSPASTPDPASPGSSPPDDALLGFVSSPLHSAHALQLYRLHLPSASLGATPKLIFVRSLHGQTGPVGALALADGRCVSVGANGGVWVWDLEGGTGAEVAAPRADAADGENRTCAAVVFDERKVVSAGVGGVEVRRFDV